LAFFFSSRRRHTRLQGDWSSDVCSSDLAEGASLAGRALDGDSATVHFDQLATDREAQAGALVLAADAALSLRKAFEDPLRVLNRSEERRVGKEGRSWRVQYSET